jgi:copper(I)-binding protein
MNNKKTVLGGLAALLLTLNAALAGAGSAAGEIAVDSPYAQAVPGSRSEGVVYMGLRNTAFSEHALVAARSPAARAAELRAPGRGDGVPQPQRLGSIEIRPAGQEVLQPGGLHILLTGLARPLHPAERLVVELEFEDGSRQSLDVPVREAGP